MTYQMARGNRTAATLDQVFNAGGAAFVTTATGVVANSVLEIGDQSTLRLNAVATAVTGTTPSVTLTLETSADGSTGWTAVSTFPAITAAGTVRKIFTGLDRFVRLNATTVSGTTPSATYTVSGESC